MINQNIDKNRFLTEKEQGFLWARFNLIFFLTKIYKDSLLTDMIILGKKNPLTTYT